jgi:hemerythrin-like metal-binding protein
MPTEWTPELLVHDDELDRQHVEIFDRLRDADAALDASREAAERSMATLVERVVEHLAAEERLMDETLYPDRTRHRAAHELFTADLLQLREELLALGPTPPVRDWLRRRVPEWFRFHIRVNDVPLAAYLARRRPQPGDMRVRRDGRRPS